MNYLASLLLGDDNNIERRNVSWNMAGSFVYALASMLLTIAAVQAAGEDEGGIFAFAFSTFGQHMFMVAYFGMRPFHITDIGNRYSFGEYLRLRIGTCVAAMVICGLYLGFEHGAGAYTPHKCLIIALMVLYKVIDAFADVYESEFQRDGRLYLTGKSLTFRTLLSVAAFLGFLIPTKQLVPACLAAVTAQAAGVLLFDIVIIRYLPEAEWTRRPGKTVSLAMANRTLFLSAILDFYVFSAAKYAIDQNMADKYQALFASIFMPTNVINLVAGFVIRPYVTIMSDDWSAGRLADFRNVVRRISAIILGLTVLAIGAAWFLGIPVLSLLYPKLSYMLEESRIPLLLIILGGACNAFINLFYYTLVIMDRKRYIFAGYVCAAAAAVFISPAAVRQYGIFGGALSYVVLMAGLALFFMGMTVRFYLERRREDA
ncbi:MAG: lipopolysaccharide biosynthesis protein [Clostridium sp.]|nr:lipopolysaccharide biosynthesis protein [Clostridium sp.]